MSPVRRTYFEGSEPASLAELDALISEERQRQTSRAPAIIALIVLGAAVIGIASAEMVYEVAEGQSPLGSLTVFVSGVAAAIAGAALMRTATRQMAQLERARDRLTMAGRRRSE